MTRPLRVHVEGGWYHVFGRGLERRAIFTEDRDREHFYELLGELSERYRICIHAHVCMTNHYHAILQTPDANLSRGMQWLHGSYSAWYNARHNRVGPLFQGRYRSIPVENSAWAYHLSLEEQLACLGCVHRHLAPGGRLILDFFQTDPRRMHDPTFLVEKETMPEEELADGRRLRRTERAVAYHRAEQINEVEIIYHLTHPDGRRERVVQAFPFRYFFRYEVEHLLARCGFELEALHGDFDGSALEDDSPEMIFVARLDRQIG